MKDARKGYADRSSNLGEREERVIYLERNSTVKVGSLFSLRAATSHWSSEEARGRIVGVAVSVGVGVQGLYKTEREKFTN